MSNLPPHHTELPSHVIEAFLNSGMFLSAQLDWAKYCFKKTIEEKRDLKGFQKMEEDEEYIKRLQYLRKAEIAYKNHFGHSYVSSIKK